MDREPIREYLKSFYTAQGTIEFEYLNEFPYTLVECRNCTLIYQQHIPNNTLMERIYEQWIDPDLSFQRQRSNTQLSTYYYYANEIIQIIAHFKKQPHDLKIFDFGIGWARWALIVKGFGCKVFGSELSESRIKHAQSNGIAMIERDNIPQHSFHFINTQEVFEHIPEPLETLRYLRKSLEPDGIIKIWVPDGKNFKSKIEQMPWRHQHSLKKALEPVSPLEHINCFNRKSLIHMAKMADLEVAPISLSYQNPTTMASLKPVHLVKNFLRPVHNKYRFQKGTCIFFKNKKPR